MTVIVDKIRFKNKETLVVTKAVDRMDVNISLRMECESDCILHWGLVRRGHNEWQRPPKTWWPHKTRVFDHRAVQTPFLRQNGAWKIDIRLKDAIGIASIPFVIHYPRDDRWENNKGRNYRIDIPTTGKDAPLETLPLEETAPGTRIFERQYDLGAGARLFVTASQGEEGYHVIFLTNLSGSPVLHWGIAQNGRQEWHLPPPAIIPQGTEIVENKAAQTPFFTTKTTGKIHLIIAEKDAPLGIPFVLKERDADRWYNDKGRNFYVPLVIPPAYEALLGDPVLADLADAIIERETGNHSWTLMHRFNLCYDLIDRVTNNPQGWALLFVWLRFSAIRQLDWQRDFNTKPRELAHALDRLTQKLAHCYGEQPDAREFIRLLFTTLGRGGDGQRVRDEILHIMHRHHIKEVAGHFMEEWHQKLHNNTTPDDVVICDAYLDFLEHNGDLDRFYSTLKRGGVSKERLRSYERPIRSDPDFIPYLKDALIHDFRQFLHILKSVHSGTDLQTAIQAAAPMVDGPLQQSIYDVQHVGEAGSSLSEQAERIVSIRGDLKALFERENHLHRDLLFLDLALEDQLRVVVERQLHHLQGIEDLIPLIDPIMKNLLFSHDDEETSCGLSHWQSLLKKSVSEKEWALETKAICDRQTRALGMIIQKLVDMLQPKAELLGKAFEAASWSISVFTEEIARGRPVFLLSALLNKLDPLLREKAHLGKWQVISPGQASGRVQQLPTLAEVQRKTFRKPTIIVTPQVAGDEELPDQIRGVMTTDTVDVVSHVAIRARDAAAVFATCYDKESMAEMISLQGEWIDLKTTASGDVTYQKGDGPIEKNRPAAESAPKHLALRRPDFSTYALPWQAFSTEVVGAKSNNLNGLRGELPSWITLPPSLALPFGVFEKILSDPVNEKTADAYETLIRKVDRLPVENRAEALEKIRQTIMGLKETEPFCASLAEVIEAEPWATNVRPHGGKKWDEAWAAIKQVWASKWNERAFLSRKTLGIPHDDLFMAVLIQPVIEAEYAFVVHTVHPVSRKEEEMFAEIVPGLGETLVGNYPGRSFSFTCLKGGGKGPEILSFPSKSTALRGKGFIFRSDSNGEDLTGYAGAGLYDSVTSEPTISIRLNYAQDRLLTDRSFRTDLLTKIADIGSAVEQIMGSAQDIEGAYCNGTYYVVQTRPQVGLA